MTAPQPASLNFLRALPKAELHLHIEGTLEPELLFELAHKHAITLPYPDVASLRRAYQFGSLQAFLDVYYQGVQVLRDADDFYALTQAYLAHARADGVIHVELFFDPQSHMERGIALTTVFAGLTRALDEARHETGLTYHLIPCFLRHLSAAAAMQTLEALLPFRALFVAVGLDSSERDHPPSKFTAVFERARAEGLLTVAHAGEEGPPEYIWQALDLLHVARIDHGVNCASDAALCQRLAATRVPLTVCPLSNVKLGVFPDMAAHNLKRLLDQRLCITLNADDPAYFGGYLLDNYAAAQDALGLTRNDMIQLARNSIEAAFLSDADKRPWLRKLELEGFPD